MCFFVPKNSSCRAAQALEPMWSVTHGTLCCSTSLTRESLLPVSETSKKSLSLAHVAPLRPLQIFCSDATVSVVHMTTVHPLCHHWCFHQRLSCHSSLFHQLCDHVDAETDDSSEKKASFPISILWCESLPSRLFFSNTKERVQRLLTIFSLLHGTHLKIWVATDKR